MLILARNPGQKILIGNDIEITVLSVRGKTVRIGVTAPRETLILRSELDPEHNFNNEEVTTSS